MLSLVVTLLFRCFSPFDCHAATTTLPPPSSRFRRHAVYHAAAAAMPPAMPLLRHCFDITCWRHAVDMLMFFMPPLLAAMLDTLLS